MNNEKKWILPQEENDKVKEEENEDEGEYFCGRCKGWGYINTSKKEVSGFTSFPIRICPDCNGEGITDWIKNATKRYKHQNL